MSSPKTISLTVSKTPARPARKTPCLALIGNPNAGKTTLFNALTGLRAKTANFPGTTIEIRSGFFKLGDRSVEIMDLPGLYSLNAATSEERVARDTLMGEHPSVDRPTAVILILDATNIERNLFLASQVLDAGLPTVVALNMIDLARAHGLKINAKILSEEIRCPVVPISARTGQGMDELKRELTRITASSAVWKSAPGPCSSCKGCPFQSRYDWAEEVGSKVMAKSHMTHGKRTEAIDRFLTHKVVGVLAFLAVMFVFFAMIFWVASYPADAMNWLFATAGGYVGSVIDFAAARMTPGTLHNIVANDLRSLLTEGILGGVGGVLVFLPQIAILFFFLSLLEDTGYLARAAFVMDRLMRRVGLPGKAFVPMLSAHACAVPAIMSTRVIEDKRDRLVTILILPLMTCSARIPVYTMVVTLMMPDRPFAGSAVFTGAYLAGIIAALAMAFVFKRSLLKGETKPLVLELPSYKVPSIKNALYSMVDRALVFVRSAGTIILLVSVLLWVLAHYPKPTPSPMVTQMTQEAQQMQTMGHTQEARDLLDQADRLSARNELAHSVAGHIGRAIEPAIQPLGYDWQIGIGLLSSFVAREVFVSTLAIVYGVGADAANDQPSMLYDTLRGVQRTDGSPVFTVATCASVLVFYVLAMQCTSTLAVIRRETGSWKWPAFQFLYMTVLAYVGALVTYQGLTALGVV